MIQVELFEETSIDELTNNINFFLSKLEDHLYIDIKYMPINDDSTRYTAMVIYRV